MESVTTVPPGHCSKAIAEASATKRLRLISAPVLSTAPPRSTSVSKITPRSAFAFTVALHTDSIAFLSSGFGTWFGNIPSGSKN